MTILAYTMPIWAVLLAWMVLRERPNASQTSLLLCALGLAVLIYPLAKGGVPSGLLLALAAGAMWGAGTVYVKWARLELDPLGATFWQLAIAFGGIAGCLIVVDGRLNLDHAHAGSILAACVHRYWQRSCLRDVVGNCATTTGGDCVARRGRYSSSRGHFYGSDYRRKAKHRRHYRLRTDLCGFGKCPVRTIDACAATSGAREY